MPEPILAIDFGTTTSAAILVTDAREQVITERSGTGLTWPSAVCFDGTELHVGTRAENLKRVHADHGRYRAEFKLELGRDAPVELGGESYSVSALISAVLAEIREAAERAAGESVTRGVLTIPASYDEGDTRRALMIGATEEAGFDIVELLPEPVAAALAPVAGPPFPEGSLILVYDLGGGTFDTALVRVGKQGNQVLGHAAIDPSRGGHGSGGRDIDAALYDDLLKSAGQPLADLVTTRRTRLQLLAKTEELKRRLTEADSAEDYFGDSDVLLTATRARLEELAGPMIDRTVECVRTMLAGTGTAIDKVDDVLLVGGATQMPVIEQAVRAALGRPVRTARAPQLAVVQGAARFAAASLTRFSVPSVRRVTERPLRWPLPGDPAIATLLRWRVPVGSAFDSGDVLADVRLADGAIWELRASSPGRLQAQHASKGATVVSGDWLVTAAELSPETAVKPMRLLELGQNLNYPIYSADFSPDNLLAATGDSGGYIWLWDAGNGVGTMYKRRDGSTVLALAFSPNGTRLASSGGANVTLWDVAGRSQLSSLAPGGTVTGLSFHPAGKRLATSGSTGVRIWELADGSHVVRSPDNANSVRFSQDGSWLASAHADGKARVWSEPAGDLLAELDHPEPVLCLAVSADDTRIATGSRQGRITIWDASRGKPLNTVSSENADIHDVAFNLEGTLLATAGGNYCRLWDAITGDALTSVEHQGSHAVAFSPDGRRLVTAGADHHVQTWLIG
jgi:Hsp70 protein/WD domain, G-beta repeat